MWTIWTSLSAVPRKAVKFNHSLAEPLMVILLTHICVTRPQSVTPIFITLTKIRMLFCSHSSTPVTPELLGISQFKGRVVHSYSFRDPVDMQGQKVLIVGAGPSARDIALEIVDSATKVNCGTDSLHSKYTEYSFICNIPGLFDWIKNKLWTCHDIPALVASANVLPAIICKIWNDMWLIFV